MERKLIMDMPEQLLNSLNSYYGPIFSKPLVVLRKSTTNPQWLLHISRTAFIHSSSPIIQRISPQDTPGQSRVLKDHGVKTTELQTKT
jgi:hypothetical protein